MRIGVVGLNFGAEFVPIYQQHPDVEQVAICDPNEAVLQRVGDRFGVEDRFTRLEDLLADQRYDAVHLLTPVPLHVEQTLAVLSAGKHCACAVPMATSLEDLWRIIAAQQAAGKNYMMMETGAYLREFFFVQDLYTRGELGALTFLRGTYYQDLEGNYPTYWRAQPPMHYLTHAIAPLLALTQKRVEKVCCMGSGRLRPDIQQPGGNSFPLQTGIFKLADSDLVAEVTRSWFQVAHPYTETFSVYGEKRGFEWLLEHEKPLLFTLEAVQPTHRGRSATTEQVTVPDRADLLPAAIARFTSGGHGGSHPHLAHEFVRSIVEGRTPAIDAYKAADWTAPGICANASALRGGEPILLPDFRIGQSGSQPS
ncbi:MAG: Gfo/Idh/MocA family oxidoreductase [Caldilineaceae bacterium]